MEARAIARHLRVSPRKARIVADYVRGKNVSDAYHVLKLVNKKAASPINKAIESAVANAVNNSEGGSHVDVDTLVVKEIFVDGGPVLKRFRPRAMGRAARIRKPTCHITVVIGETEV